MSESAEIAGWRQLDGSRVRFRRVPVHQTHSHIEFGFADARDMAVQINEPKSSASENPLSAVGIDERGRRFLLRQGVIHGNTDLDRVEDHEFQKRTGLVPAVVTVNAKPAKRRWYVVTALDGTSDAKVRQATASFVELCWVARSWGKQSAATQARIEALFGKPESGGSYDYEVNPGRKTALRTQGYVWEDLQRLLPEKAMTKPRHVRGYEVDALVRTPTGSLLVEIKTSLAAADVYCGVGQLSIYPLLFPELAEHPKILLLPGHPTDALVQALRSGHIELHYYTLSRRGGKPHARFSAEFLRSCGLSDTEIAAV